MQQFIIFGRVFFIIHFCFCNYTYFGAICICFRKILNAPQNAKFLAGIKSIRLFLYHVVYPTRSHPILIIFAPFESSQSQLSGNLHCIKIPCALDTYMKTYKASSKSLFEFLKSASIWPNCGQCFIIHPFDLDFNTFT